MNSSRPPFSYEEQNVYNSIYSPSTIHVKNTNLSRFFARYLFQKAISVFKWELPENWRENYFLYTLYGWGFIAVLNTRQFGVICQGCSLRGYDVYYQPTNAIIANPLLRGIVEPRIDKECTLIRLQPDYNGIIDLVNYYADMMALCSEAAAVNLVNSKTAFIYFAENKAQAETYKKMYDEISAGNPASVIGKGLRTDSGEPLYEMFNRDVKNGYITSDVLEDMRKIEQMFDTDIGIANANTSKRERLLVDEVNSNNNETACKAELWLDSIKKSVKKTNEMFGTEIKVDWRVNPYEGGNADDVGRTGINRGNIQSE